MGAQHKIIFFDLDGTLLRSQDGHIAFNRAILDTFGFPGDIRTIRPDGKTDPQILREIFDVARREVYWGPADWQTFSARLEECFTEAISQGSTRVRALSGVPELVRELSRLPDFHLGVVTGNMEVTARLKLQAAGIGEYLGTGAFGSDSAARNELPKIAMKRWSCCLKLPVESSDCVVVGDTPRDFEAARVNKMKCLLVATGRSHPIGELRKLQPDYLLPDFSDTQGAVDALVGLFE